MTVLYLLRHGAIDWPEPDTFIGQTDPPLSAEGRRQALAWRDPIGEAGFSAVWSSDLKRCAETAALVFGGGQAQIRFSSGLREIHLGGWDGIPRRRIREGHPDLWEARGRDLGGFRPPGGESFRDLQQRVVSRVGGLVAKDPGPVCIVTHAGVIRVLICHCLGMPLANLFRLRLDPARLSVVSMAPERLELLGLNLPAPGPGGVPDRRPRGTAGPS
ncbi:MAG: histidine phosphatase family protein [Desulfobacteraceae bacterium]|jgi:probable phosphoglycerate mutase|nr:histidine phosphatase family protein [Desulfobacteraceae bacterium]